MPEFSNPFSGLAANRKVTHEELVRAIRFMVAAEYEAVQLYTQLAESTDNRLAQEVLKDIADEEIVHAGEFLKLLKVLAPTETAFYAQGEAEVEELMAELSVTSQEKPALGELAAAQETDRAENPVSTKETENIIPPGVGNLFKK